MTEDRVRVLRVLEYEGPRSWVEVTLAVSIIKGCKAIQTPNGPAVIREAMLGEVPTILQHGAEKAVSKQQKEPL